MFKYIYVDEEQNDVKLMEGEAYFKVKNAHLKNKNGEYYKDGSMLLTLEILDLNGNKARCVDMLIGTEKMAWKTRAFCKAIGSPSLFNRTGILDHNAILDLDGPCEVEYKTSERDGKVYNNLTIKRYLEKSSDYKYPEDDEIPF